MSLSLQRYCKYGGAKLENILRKREERRRKTCSDVNILHYSKGLDDECLFYEILSWLPVKFLLRFKSVCKSWCAMIKSQSFVYNHLKQQYNNPIHGDCLIAMSKVGTNNSKSIQIILCERHEVITCAKLDDKPDYDHDFCGPCHGLYYVWSAYGDMDRGLWNPSLNEYKRLPPINIELNIPSNLKFDCWEYYGLGFDPVTRDYKVVIIKAFVDKYHYWDDVVLENIIPPSVFVYSLRTNSWKYVANLPKFYCLFYHQSYVFANTNLYWLASSKDRNLMNQEAIIVFDLATDKCRDIQLPECRTKNSISRMFWVFESLIVYNGDMAYVRVDQDNNCFVVWALRDGYWAKKLSMRVDFEIQEPLGQWRDGFVVFIARDGVTTFLCNLDTQETWELTGLPVVRYEDFFNCAYEESLVSLRQ